MPENDCLKILAICGSLREKSYHRALLQAQIALAPAGMRIELHPGIGDIPLYNFDRQDREGFPEEVIALDRSIRAADGIIIASPEYNWSVPGALKNALDWVSRLKDHGLHGKPVMIQSASAGALGGSRGQYHLRQILACLGANCLPKPEVFVNYMAGKIDVETAAITDEPTRDIIAKQLGAFARYARLLKASGELVERA